MALSVVNEKDRLNKQSKALKRKPTNSYVRIYKPFMQNKPNFRNDKMNITIDMTSIYKIFCCSPGAKNKPNSKPIKPKTNPIKAKTNPIQTQSKPIPPAITAPATLMIDDCLNPAYNDPGNF